MNVFVGTHLTQGQRKNDFCWTTDGELLVHGFRCDSHRGDADGSCGCGRSMCGMDSHQATTTILVEDRKITKKQFVELRVASAKASGWLKYVDDKHNAKAPYKCHCYKCMVRRYKVDADKLLADAAFFKPGQVLECRDGVYAERKLAPDSVNTFEKRVGGTRKVYGIIENGKGEIVVDCNVSDCLIRFQVQVPAMLEYFAEGQRRCIQDIFPTLCKEHREILLSGSGPAEFDSITGKKMPKTRSAFMRKYKKFGYEWPKN